MQVFNRHVSAQGADGLQLRDGADLRVDSLAARVHGSLDVALERALEDRARHGGVRALLLLQRPVRPDGRALAGPSCWCACCARQARRRSCSASVSVVVPVIIIGHGIFLTSRRPAARRRAGVADGVRRPHAAIRISRSACSSSAPARWRRLVARQIQSQHDFAYRIVGYWLRRRRRPPTTRSGLDLPLLGSAVDVARLAGLHQINRVIVSLSDRRGHLPIQELLRAKLSGVRVEDAATTYERITGKILTDGLDAELVDLLGRLLRQPEHPRVQADRRCRAGGRRPRARGAADAADGDRRPARFPRPDLLPPGARRRERPAVHAVQVPLDAERRRAGHADLGDRATTAA